MKSVIIITLISFCTLHLSAQTVAMAPKNNPTTSTAKVEKKALKKHHTLSALQQINVHLNKHLSYTPSMEETQAEGQVTLVVNLNAKGKIASFKIENNSSPALTTAVQEAMDKMDHILFHGASYAGTSQVRIPIKFFLR